MKKFESIWSTWRKSQEKRIRRSVGRNTFYLSDHEKNWGRKKVFTALRKMKDKDVEDMVLQNELNVWTKRICLR